MLSEELKQARAAMLSGAANGETAAAASASAAAAATAAAVAVATATATAAAATAELAARDEEMARLRAELQGARGSELEARGGAPRVASSELGDNLGGELEDLRAELLETRFNLERCQAELAISRRPQLGTQEAAEARGWGSTELTCLVIELTEAEAAAAAVVVTAAKAESGATAAAEEAAVAAAAAALRGQRWAYEIVELKQQLITEQAARATVEALLAAGQGERGERGEGDERGEWGGERTSTSQASPTGTELDEAEAEAEAEAGAEAGAEAEAEAEAGRQESSARHAAMEARVCDLEAQLRQQTTEAEEEAAAAAVAAVTAAAAAAAVARQELAATMASLVATSRPSTPAPPPTSPTSLVCDAGDVGDDAGDAGDAALRAAQALITELQATAAAAQVEAVEMVGLAARRLSETQSLGVEVRVHARTTYLR